MSAGLEDARCLFRRRLAIIEVHQIAIVVVIKESFEWPVVDVCGVVKLSWHLPCSRSVSGCLVIVTQSRIHEFNGTVGVPLSLWRAGVHWAKTTVSAVGQYSLVARPRRVVPKRTEEKFKAFLFREARRLGQTRAKSLEFRKYRL